MKDYLKPCPFCGGKAILEVIPPHSHQLASFMPDTPGAAIVACVRCGAALMERKPRAAMRRWNGRTGPRPRKGCVCSC